MSSCALGERRAGTLVLALSNSTRWRVDARAAEGAGEPDDAVAVAEAEAQAEFEALRTELGDTSRARRRSASTIAPASCITMDAVRKRLARSR